MKNSVICSLRVFILVCGLVCSGDTAWPPACSNHIINWMVLPNQKKKRCWLRKLLNWLNKQTYLTSLVCAFIKHMTSPYKNTFAPALFIYCNLCWSNIDIGVSLRRSWVWTERMCCVVQHRWIILSQWLVIHRRQQEIIIYVRINKAVHLSLPLKR